ncbi:hypothetical protein ACIODS_04210 [Micromonospora chalcea]|uniref:hypothetical protein n=1 Tax=Micromonospora chalcea TaxID=1874 RepID=UPI003827BBD1
MSSRDRDQREDPIEWLTPLPEGEDVTLLWPDQQDGPLVLTCHWAFIDGRAVMVGLDVRTFTETDGQRQPGPGGVREVRIDDLTGLSIREIRELSRAKLAGMAMTKAGATRRTAERAPYDQVVTALTTRGTPRRRRPPAGDVLLRIVADRYREALALGGTPARRPAVYVTEQLREKGWEYDGPAVRKLIQRARQQGLLPAATPRRPG